MNTGVIVLLGGVVALSFCSLLAYLVSRFCAKKYVFGNRERFDEICRRLTARSRDPAVSDESRLKLAYVRMDFVPICNLTSETNGVKWLQVREDLDRLIDDLEFLESEMEREMETNIEHRL
jgi:hypothetical protein